MNRRQLLKSIVTLAAVATLAPITANAAPIKHGKKYPFIRNRKTRRANRHGDKQKAIDLQLDQISRYQQYLAK